MKQAPANDSFLLDLVKSAAAGTIVLKHTGGSGKRSPGLDEDTADRRFPSEPNDQITKLFVRVHKKAHV